VSFSESYLGVEEMLVVGSVEIGKRTCLQDNLIRLKIMPL